MAWPHVQLASRPVLLQHGGYALHAMISSAGHEHATDAGYSWHGLSRGRGEFVLLQHTLAGEGELRRDGRTWRLRPGQTMLLNIPDDHLYRLPPGGDWRFFYVCMYGGEVWRAWRRIIAARGPVVELGRQSDALLAAERTCRAVIGEQVTSTWQASALAYDLTMKLLAALLPQPAGPHDADTPPQHAAGLDAALDHLRRHPGRRISVAELADIAGYSQHHFSRVFKQHQGLSPGDFILRERLRHAARLLHRTDQPIKAIAARCDFNDTQYFSRMFKRAYGMTPGTFRKSGIYR